MTCSNEEHCTLHVRRCSPQAVGAGPEACSLRDLLQDEMVSV